MPLFMDAMAAPNGMPTEGSSPSSSKRDSLALLRPASQRPRCGVISNLSGFGGGRDRVFALPFHYGRHLNRADFTLRREILVGWVARKRPLAEPLSPRGPQHIVTTS